MKFIRINICSLCKKSIGAMNAWFFIALHHTFAVRNPSIIIVLVRCLIALLFIFEAQFDEVFAMEQPDNSQELDNDDNNVRYWQSAINEARKEMEDMGLNRPDSELNEDEREMKQGFLEGIKEIQDLRKGCISDAIKEKSKNDFSGGAEAAKDKRASNLENEVTKKKKS